MSKICRTDQKHLIILLSIQFSAFLSRFREEIENLDRGVAVLYVIDNIIISHLFLEFLWDTNTQFVSPTIQAVDHRVDSKAIQTLKYIFCLGDLLEAVTFWLLSCDSSATTKLCLFLTQNILVCCPRASHMHSTILGKLLIIPKGFLLTFYGLLVLSWQYQLTR